MKLMGVNVWLQTVILDNFKEFNLIEVNWMNLIE